MMSYDMTYGQHGRGNDRVCFSSTSSGLGVVIGAELNAALAETPAEQQNRIGQADDRERRMGPV